MRTTKIAGVAASAVAGIVLGVAIAGQPVESQDRGTPVIVTNTEAEPVPTKMVGDVQLEQPMTVRTDEREPLHVTNVPGQLIQVCPRTCGAYQRTHHQQGAISPIAFDDVGVGTRLVVQNIAVEVRFAGSNPQARLLGAFDGKFVRVPIPLQVEKIHQQPGSPKTWVGNHLVHLFVERSSEADPPPAIQIVGVEFGEVFVTLSGILEPLPAP